MESAANALHIANDYIMSGCLWPCENSWNTRRHYQQIQYHYVANDTGYDNIYSNQLQVRANLAEIILSGSGNSSNIVSAIKVAKDLKMTSIAIWPLAEGNVYPLLI